MLKVFLISLMITVMPLQVETGLATYYSNRFHGRKTASGERYNKNHYTAAHKKLPFGTIVRVTRQDNGKSVLVKVNDRGPFGKGRVIDLSYIAAKDLGIIGRGKARVSVERVDNYEWRDSVIVEID